MEYSTETLSNNMKNTVKESLRGIAMVHSGLVVLDGFNAILHRDYNQIRHKVRIISGGGSENISTLSGCVGPGMLTAVIFGNSNCAPNICSIYQVIKELATYDSAEILIIIQNNLEYVLNFTLAKNQALKDGIQVKILVIQDGVTSHSAKKTHGFLNALFIYKIAGAMAEKGSNLDAIFSVCEQIAQTNLWITDIGINNVVCCSTGDTRKEVEIGCRTYKEQEKQCIQFSSWYEIVHVMIKILSTMEQRLFDTNGLAICLNNLNNYSQLEMNIFIRELLQQLSKRGMSLLKIYIGHSMSVKNHAFHISFLDISKKSTLYYLDEVTLATSWPRVFSAQALGLDITNCYDFSYAVVTGKHANINKEEELPIDTLSEGLQLTDFVAQAFSKIIICACDAVIACENQLNIIDGDDIIGGYFGSNFANAAKLIRNAAINNRLITSKPCVAFSQISKIIQKTMDGLEGGIYTIFFDAISQTFASKKDITPDLWLIALSEANEAISRLTGLKEGDHAMLDSLLTVQNCFQYHLSLNSPPIQAFGNAVKAAEEKALSTAIRSLKNSRPCSAKNQDFQHPDVEAHAVGIWLRATYEGIKLNLYNFDKK